MTAHYREFFLSCCGGWHAAHHRVLVGSYHEWLLTKLYRMAQGGD